MYKNLKYSLTYIYHRLHQLGRLYTLAEYHKRFQPSNELNPYHISQWAKENGWEVAFINMHDKETKQNIMTKFLCDFVSDEPNSCRQQRNQAKERKNTVIRGKNDIDITSHILTIMGKKKNSVYIK